MKDRPDILAQADHTNMGSLSKQHQKTKIADSTVHFQPFEKCKFQKISGKACPRCPLEFLGASGTRNTGHLWLWCNLQQQSHSLETVRLRVLDLCFLPVRHGCKLYSKVIHGLYSGCQRPHSMRSVRHC